jgi:hypothetical protein
LLQSLCHEQNHSLRFCLSQFWRDRICCRPAHCVLAQQRRLHRRSDGTNEKKLADGIFPAISPDGARVAFNTVEKTSDTTYVRHMAVVDVATGKVNVFKDVPSDNSYYPSWTADGNKSFSPRGRTKFGISSLLIPMARISMY